MLPLTRPYTTEEELDAVADVLRSGWLTQGPKVEEFEQQFAEYVGAKHAVAVSNCTSGLHLVLLAHGIGQGDEVICPSFSYIATANSITHTGAVPVFADVEAEKWTLDLRDVERKITARTKAVLVVHHLGMPADLRALSELCRRKNIVLLEDAACAAGSEYFGKKIGGHGNTACFSFHPRKMLTTGEGGMITTDDDEIAKYCRLYRHHGMSVSDRARFESAAHVADEHVVRGYNCRMSDIAAAIGIVQLHRLPEMINELRRLAALYTEGLKSIPDIRLQNEPAGYRTNYQSYAIALEGFSSAERDAFIAKLKAAEIGARRGTLTAHREPAYRDFPRVSLPVSERLSDSSVLLPLFVGMREGDISHVLETVKTLLSMRTPAGVS